MEVTPEISKELKAVELEILRQFIKVCDELELRYYVAGGTLLGAVRHKGFIPWDDDIDVCMPREDYEVFLQKGQSLLKDPYFLQTFRTDTEYPANFAKIRNSNTTFIETSVRNCKINHGVYIDIFPLDYYPDSKWKARVLELKKLIYTGRIASVFYTTEKISFKGKLLRLGAKIMVPTVKRAVSQREELFLSCKNTGKIANYSGAWGKKEIVPAEWFGAGCTLAFENLAVNAPEQYDKWLTQVYGNYMQPPPVEQQKGHHYADVIDLHRPYTEYTKDEK